MSDRVVGVARALRSERYPDSVAVFAERLDLSRGLRRVFFTGLRD